MTPDTPELSARISPDWTSAILRADQIRTDTLRALAEAWAENPDLVTAVLDRLAEAATSGPVGAWEAAALDAEADLQMDMPEMRLSEIQAERLADELEAASRATLSARLRGPRLVEAPIQQDEEKAA